MDDFSFVTMEQALNMQKEARSDADQLAWDRFAAAALSGLCGHGEDSTAVPFAAAHADMLMLERAKRLTPRKG